MKYLLLLLLLTGCAIHLVGQYDQTLDSGISTFQAKCAQYFAQRADSSVEFTQVFYDGVGADLQALTTRAKGIPQDSLTVKVFGNMQHTLSTMDSVELTDHQSNTNPSKALLRFAAETINQDCQRALTFELAKKRGQP